jgi:hypothetical protein
MPKPLRLAAVRPYDKPIGLVTSWRTGSTAANGSGLVSDAQFDAGYEGLKRLRVGSGRRLQHDTGARRREATEHERELPRLVQWQRLEGGNESRIQRETDISQFATLEARGLAGDDEGDEDCGCRR